VIGVNISLYTAPIGEEEKGKNATRVVWNHTLREKEKRVSVGGIIVLNWGGREELCYNLSFDENGECVVKWVAGVEYVCYRRKHNQPEFGGTGILLQRTPGGSAWEEKPFH